MFKHDVVEQDDAVKIDINYLCTFLSEYKKIQVTPRITCNYLTLYVPNERDNTNVLCQLYRAGAPD